MDKRRFMKKNEGYSLIEMIIVIAIIAILSAAAMVTISIMHSAKAKEASSTLEDSLSELQSNAKGKMCVTGTVTDPTNKVNQKDYRFALAIYKQDRKYYIIKGYYMGTGDMDSASNYWFPADENVGAGKGTSLSSYVTVRYFDSDGTEKVIGDLDTAAVYIVYDKQGMCIHGTGKYQFARTLKQSPFAVMTLNKNGSHSSN